MYRFTVAFRSHRASSPPSTELHIMTPPGPPTQPVAVHTGAREATLKWYPGAGGAAYKYQVYVQKVASRLGGGTTRGTKNGGKNASGKNASASGNRNWDKCYEGSDTVCRITDKLEPDSMYNFKVVAMNRQYVNGDASLPTQVCTVRKQDEMACTRDTVDDMFTIDCTGDVVTGDTVLFTERVYAAVKATPEQPVSVGGVVGWMRKLVQSNSSLSCCLFCSSLSSFFSSLLPPSSPPFPFFSLSLFSSHRPAAAATATIPVPPKAFAKVIPSR